MEEILGWLQLAGFCFSLVGLKFPRSGHCLSDGVATTTRDRPAHITNLRSSSVAVLSESSPSLAPLRLCRQDRLRVQLHRLSIIRQPHLSILDLPAEMHDNRGKAHTLRIGALTMVICPLAAA